MITNVLQNYCSLVFSSLVSEFKKMLHHFSLISFRNRHNFFMKLKKITRDLADFSDWLQCVFGLKMAGLGISRNATKKSHQHFSRQTLRFLIRLVGSQLLSKNLPSISCPAQRSLWNKNSKEKLYTIAPDFSPQNLRSRISVDAFDSVFRSDRPAESQLESVVHRTQSVFFFFIFATHTREAQQKRTENTQQTRDTALLLPFLFRRELRFSNSLFRASPFSYWFG